MSDVLRSPLPLGMRVRIRDRYHDVLRHYSATAEPEGVVVGILHKDGRPVGYEIRHDNGEVFPWSLREVEVLTTTIVTATDGGRRVR